MMWKIRVGDEVNSAQCDMQYRNEHPQFKSNRELLLQFRILFSTSFFRCSRFSHILFTSFSLSEYKISSSHGKVNSPKTVSPYLMRVQNNCETLSMATPLHILHVPCARFESNGATNKHDEFFIGSNVDASIWKHEYHDEFQRERKKKKCGKKHSFLAFQLITRINVCMNEYEMQHGTEREWKRMKIQRIYLSGDPNGVPMP